MDTGPDTGPPVEWLTVTEAGQRVDKSSKTIRRRIRTGELIAQRSGDADTSPWLVNSVSLADVYPTTIGEAVADQAAEVTAALSTQLSDVLVMLADARAEATDNAVRAARAETERDHLKTRLAEIRADLQLRANPPPKRWWRR